MLANNWSTSSSVCTCDDRHNRVHSLNLLNMNLVILELRNNSFGGESPKEICRLHRLKFLDTAYNKFVEEIPAILGNLSQLQYLELGYNNFNVGFIPQSIDNNDGRFSIVEPLVLPQT
ncbi:receptor-like protein 37 [Trifolium pratense]|uniref:receptor-like protein 37 n=1 Tax=Trifolium pratense TaxID=57577 RepID=UPI001E690B6E|nr:receptor-like protein 37 [Trifolium pratense]